MAPGRDVRGRSFAVLAVGLLFVGPVEIFAQSSTVVCGSSFGWMNNSKGQNPCVVAAYLQGACNNGLYFVGPLPNNTFYVGPTAENRNECKCSTVTYTTMSACAACQNHEYISWSSWDYNCSTLYLGVFPPGIPNGTAVPQWAFQDMKSYPLFNVTLAESVGDNPESTATNPQATSSLGATSAFASASLTQLTSASGSVSSVLATSDSTSTAASGSTSTATSGSISTATSDSTSTTTSISTSSSSSPTREIIGGVIGSVVGVILIAGVVTFFVVKKRSQIPTLIESIDRPASRASSLPPGYTDVTPFHPQMAQPSVNDAVDPNMFSTPGPSAIRMTESLGKIRNPTFNHSNISVQLSERHTGRPVG